MNILNRIYWSCNWKPFTTWATIFLFCFLNLVALPILNLNFKLPQHTNFISCPKGPQTEVKALLTWNFCKVSQNPNISENQIKELLCEKKQDVWNTCFIHNDVTGDFLKNINNQANRVVRTVKKKASDSSLSDIYFYFYGFFPWYLCEVLICGW